MIFKSKKRKQIANDMEKKIDFAIKQFIHTFPIEQNMLTQAWESLQYFRDPSKHYLDLLYVHTLSRKDLVQLCKKYECKCSGKKEDLVQRLQRSHVDHFYYAFLALINTVTSDENKKKQYTLAWEKMTFDFSSLTYEELRHSKLLNYTKPVLVGLCKRYRVDHKGKRNILIERLDRISNISYEGEKHTRKKKTLRVKKTTVFHKKQHKILRINARPSYELIKKTIGTTDCYLEPKSRFIMNKEYIVIGKWLNNQYQRLSKQDMKECRLLRFQHIIPVNLDC